MAKQGIKQSILKWCKEENLFREEKKDKATNFNLAINFPERIPHAMNVFQPKGKKDLIYAICVTNVSPEHIEKMKSCMRKELEEFLWDLRFTLGSRPTTEFDLKVTDGVVETVVITAPIYADGLTKDRFMSALREVYKSKLLAVWKIRQRFGG